MKHSASYPEQNGSVLSRSAPENPAAFSAGLHCLHSREAAPKISAFMKFTGETRTISKPGAARWALLFMGTDGWLPGLAPLSEPKRRQRSFASLRPTTKAKSPASGRRYITIRTVSQAGGEAGQPFANFAQGEETQ
ncbi:MAG: hypothetical protein ACRD5K_04040 [Candidatus Acidiferrales bacterium]